jgi:glycosyltransferase involved in cell wall biosynthesis
MVNQEKRKIKFCLIIHSLGIGGMERVMAELANNFSARKNIEVHLVMIGIKRNIEYPISESILIHRPGFEFDNSRRTLDTFRTLRFIRSKIKEIGPDKVLGFGELWNNLVLLSLYGLRIPVFVSDRSEPNKDLGRIHNFLRDKLYPTAAGYVAQTDEARRICEENRWNTNIRVIGNPIREIKPDDNITRENIVLTVGRLIKTKNIDQLIQIFNSINQPGWKLVIVGGNAKKLRLFEDLQMLINDLGAEDKIFLEGKQKNVERYYNKSKLFAFTSSSEGFPNVIGEALSAGLPVVAYDCVAGPSDMIDDGDNGFLIPLFDQKKFTDKLRLLMENSELRCRMAENAKKIVDKFSVNKIADQFYSFMLEDR